MKHFRHAAIAALISTIGLAAAVNASAPSSPVLRSGLASVAVPFVANEGQHADSIRFQASTFAGNLYVTGDGTLVYALASRSPQRAGSPAHARAVTSVMLRESFVGGHARPRGGERSATNMSFLTGDIANHRPHVAAFDSVELGEVFAGVAVTLRARGRNVEKIYTVAPGGDPASIAMAIDGANRLELGDDGALVVSTPAGNVQFTPPVAYQELAGKREAVRVDYALNAAGHRYGFRVGDYDTNRPLVIDPLLQTTFLGGGSTDLLRQILIHPTSNEIYVLGETLSNNLSCTTTATQGCQNGVQEAPLGAARNCYLARLNAQLTTLLQATYLGGTSTEFCNGIAFAPNGLSLYVGGTTQSTSPLAVGGAQSVHGSALNNAFVARINSAMTGLMSYTFYGASGGEAGIAIAVHPGTGDVWLAGNTQSASGLLGIGASSAQSIQGNTIDGYVARFNPTLTGVVRATYLGGSSLLDQPEAIAYNALNDQLYVGGITTSSDYPQLAGGALSAVGVGGDRGFITRLSADLTAIRQSTLFGGSDGQSGVYALVINPATSDVYVTGFTTSTLLIGASSGALPSHAADSAQEDAFVAHFDGSLTTLYRSTYFGGNGQDYAEGIAVHPLSGEIYIAGRTQSSNLPGTSGSIQASKQNGTDGFVARFSPSLARLAKATYFGGASDDSLMAIAIHPASGDVYVAGQTLSGILAGTLGGAQSTHASIFPAPLDDGLIVRMSGDLTASDTTPGAFSFAPRVGVAPLTVQTSDAVQMNLIAGTANVYVEGSLTSAYCVSSANNCSCDQSGGVFTATPGTIVNGQFVCVRHTSAATTNQITSTTLFVGARSATFRVGTGTPLGDCTLDVDGNNAQDALTDGLIIIRAMFGLTGTTVTNNAIGGGASRGTWPLIRTYMNGNCGSNFAP